MALLLSALLLILVVPVVFLFRHSEYGPWLAAACIAALIAQYAIVTRFTRFIPTLAGWARALAHGKAIPLPSLDNGAPEIRELGRLLNESAEAVRHQHRALVETRDLLDHLTQRLRKWSRNAGEVFFELDAQGRILFVSDAWESLTGFAQTDAAGKPLSAFFLDEDAARDFAPEKLATGSISGRCETTLRTENERPLRARIDFEIEKNERGEIATIHGIIADITRNAELQQLVTRYEDELYQTSVLDPLTGLYNRHHFDLQLETILADHLSSRRAVCLLLIDVDGFKFINDTYGHPCGDEVLRTMAQRLREQVRRNDYLARVGGNEFAMVLKNTELAAATRIAHKLHARINETRIVIQTGHMNLQASIGVVEAPRHGSNAQELLSAADVALYYSRRHGPNRVETLAPDTSKAMISIFGQGFNLRRAIDAGDVHPAFQPIYDMQRREPLAYEVLARIKIDGLVIQAQDFIGMAQEFGLTRDMDIHVIRRALECTPTEQALFLNVDLQSFNDPTFIEELVDLLGPARRSGRSITIEITERESVTPSETLAIDIRRLRALGCRLALDDFGSGYSAYKLIDLIRPDYLKIEGSFVRGMVHNEADHKIVSHIHELARSFGMQTIAESVEDAAIEKALRDIGIRNAQGLHFGAPMLITRN
jgi:diguanylate cyclase (GGDEF)-like protein/PAS domain S-box-containing protein